MTNTIRFKEKFKPLIQKSLSDRDIKKFFDNQIKIMRYSELSKYDNIKDVLHPYNRVIILIEAGDSNHWVLLQLIQHPSKKPYILFFDSYGISVGNEFDVIPRSIQHMTKQDRNQILHLLINQPLPVHYNQYRLQKLQDGVNTCGRWCSVKGMLMDMTEDEFNDTIRNICKQEDLLPDELICVLYEGL